MIILESVGWLHYQRMIVEDRNQQISIKFNLLILIKYIRRISDSSKSLELEGEARAGLLCL